MTLRSAPSFAASLLLALGLVLATSSPADAKGKKKKKAADGATLFAENCAYCHGNGGRGDGPNAKHLDPGPADLTKLNASEAQIADVVRGGKGSCPSWRASFDDAEIAAVSSWAKKLQR